jgi:hypothetical protein
MFANAMIDLVLERTRTAAGDTAVTRARILNWLNEALRRYQGDRRWPWLDATSQVTTVAGQAAYSLPSGWQSIRHIRLDPTVGGAAQLEQVSPEEMATLSAESQQAPRLFAIVSPTQFEVWPKPITAGDTLDIYFTRTEADLTDSGASAPYLPPELRDVLIDHAVRAAFLAKGNLEEAGQVPFIESEQSQRRLRAAAAARRGRPRVRARRW